MKSSEEYEEEIKNLEIENMNLRTEVSVLKMKLEREQDKNPLDIPYKYYRTRV